LITRGHEIHGFRHVPGKRVRVVLGIAFYEGLRKIEDLGIGRSVVDFDVPDRFRLPDFRDPDHDRGTLRQHEGPGQSKKEKRKQNETREFQKFRLHLEIAKHLVVTSFHFSQSFFKSCFHAFISDPVLYVSQEMPSRRRAQSSRRRRGFPLRTRPASK